jgi:hypothetical protein
VNRRLPFHKKRNTDTMPNNGMTSDMVKRLECRI